MSQPDIVHPVDPQWKSVRSGLQLMVVAYVIVFGVVVLGLIYFALPVNRPPLVEQPLPLPPAKPIFTRLDAALASSVPLLTYLLGMILCARCPSSQARVPIVAATVCLALAALFNYLQLFSMPLEGAAQPDVAALGSLALAGLSGTLWLAATMLEVLFVKSVAEIFANERLVKSADRFIIFLIVLTVVTFAGVGLAIVTPAMLQRGRNVGSIEEALTLIFSCAAWILMPIGYLVRVVWFLGLLSGAIATIGLALRPPPAEQPPSEEPDNSEEARADFMTPRPFNTVVSCPQCQVTTIFAAGTVGAVPCLNCGAPIEPPPQQDDKPGVRPWRPDNRVDPTSSPTWKFVRAGLRSMFVSILLGIVFAAFATAYAVTLELQPPPANRARAGVIALSLGCFAVCLLACWLAYLIGMILCVAAPEGRARIFAAAALLCALVSIALRILQGALPMGPPGLSGIPSGIALVFVFDNLVTALGGLLVTFFLQRVANVFEDPGLVRNCRRFVTFQVGWYLATGVLVAILVIYAQTRGLTVPNDFWLDPLLFVLACLLIVIAGAGGITFLVWHLLLLARTRNLLRDAIAANEVWTASPPPRLG